jgi:hypothetical protein
MVSIDPEAIVADTEDIAKAKGCVGNGDVGSRTW